MNEQKARTKIRLETPSHDVRLQRMIEQIEAKATERYGPPAERAKKNQEHVNKLATQYGEQTVRAILKTLAGLVHQEDPTFVHILKQYNLDQDDLSQIILYHDLGGPRIHILSQTGDEYHVEVETGYYLHLRHFDFVIAQTESAWVIKSIDFYLS